jgi:hypothetical protein
MHREQALKNFYMVKEASESTLPKQRREMGQVTPFLDMFNKKRRAENAERTRVARKLNLP